MRPFGFLSRMTGYGSWLAVNLTLAKRRRHPLVSSSALSLSQGPETRMKFTEQFYLHAKLYIFIVFRIEGGVATFLNNTQTTTTSTLVAKLLICPIPPPAFDADFIA